MAFLSPRFIGTQACALFVVTILAGASFAHAESVQWNESGPTLVAPGSKGRRTTILYNPSMSVHYNVRVSLLDGNGTVMQVLPSEASVCKDSRVLYEFIPHTEADLYWFGTGKSWDTPYGTWRAGAAGPANADMCAPKNLFDEPAPFKLYADFAVAPPVKSVAPTGLGVSCTTLADGISKDCTLAEAGTVAGTFTFAPTIGHFYSGYTSDTYEYPQNVGGVSYSGRRTVSNGTNSCGMLSQSVGHHVMKVMANCTAQSCAPTKANTGDYTAIVPQKVIPHTLTVTEGSCDDLEDSTPTTPTLSIPSASSCVVGESTTISMSATDPDGDNLHYLIDWNDDGSTDQIVPSSGYVPSGSTQSASRTFASTGSKTVRVRAQDEGGALSPWATLTFSCASNPDGEDDGELNGLPDLNPDPGTPQPPAIDLSLRAIPSLVRNGDTTKINWSATGVTSCTVTAPNGDSWSGLESPVGGETSRPITAQTVYTLRCQSSQGVQTKTATVNVLPTWREQ